MTVNVKVDKLYNGFIVNFFVRPWNFYRVVVTGCMSYFRFISSYYKFWEVPD